MNKYSYDGDCFYQRELSYARECSNKCRCDDMDTSLGY